MRTFTLGVLGLGLAAAPVGTYGADVTYLVRARVPVYCVVQQQGPGAGEVDGAGFSLGQFREYCNAPGGYELIVRYQPGTLQGAVLRAGSDEVALDGSGETVLSRATGPRIVKRTIVVTPGAAGFDTDRLELVLLPQA